MQGTTEQHFLAKRNHLAPTVMLKTASVWESVGLELKPGIREPEAFGVNQSEKNVTHEHQN